MSNMLKEFFSHLMNAGSFNEGRQGQVSGGDLPEDVRRRVDQLAAQRELMSNLTGPEAQKQLQAIQQSINLLYNPRTRPMAMASWQQLHGDEGNPWSATGGHLGTAADIVNQMTLDPRHNLYGTQRSGGEIPQGARVASD